MIFNSVPMTNWLDADPRVGSMEVRGAAPKSLVDYFIAQDLAWSS